MRPLILLCIIPIGAFVGVIAAEDGVRLPEPFATPSARNAPKVIPRPAGVELKVPAGFMVEEYLAGFDRPRYMALGPHKELLIADSHPDGVVWLAQGKDKRM